MSTFSSLSLFVLTAPGGTLVLDATPYLTALTFETGEHGFASLRADARVPAAVAWQLYSHGPPLYLLVADGPKIAWEGRAEDIGLGQDRDGTQLTISGFGGWNALSDVPYTALWSDSGYDNWEATSRSGAATWEPSKYNMDTNGGRLSIAPKKNQTYGSSVSYGAGVWTYQSPYSGSRQITVLSFDISQLMPTGWTVEIGKASRDYSTLTPAYTLAATGSPQTVTSQTVTITSGDALYIALYYSGATTTYGGEDGANYVHLANVRVTTASSVTTAAIASDLVSTVAAANSTQLSSSTVLLQSTGVDLTDVIYEDQYPADILTQLATDARWETGVYENQRVYFRPKYSASSSWLVDIDTLDLERTLSTLYNSAYGVYKDASGRTQRTATSTNAASLTQTGLTRREAVSAATTSSTQATAIRDASLSDTATPYPRATFHFPRVYTLDGAQAPPWLVRAGDQITIRNLPITLGTAVDRIRTFRVSRTTYDAFAKGIGVEPEAPLPTLPILVAEVA